ncbi:hypothetical protein JCM33374_g5135 [Metschnikowia sp. JCM 33374]|nr:hypothetical protein JCM33374_g5135 [Metschnikowia sp. JCM 33374]
MALQVGKWPQAHFPRYLYWNPSKENTPKPGPHAPKAPNHNPTKSHSPSNMALYPLPLNLRVVFFYNLASFTLWCCCLGRFLVLLPLVGRQFLPAGIADFFHVVATLPLLGFFVVKFLAFSSDSPASASSEQQGPGLWGLFNGLRLVWVCYGVIFPHPKIAKHTTYSLLILAWCTQNIIDLAYHSFKLKTRTSPWFLFALHYNHFYVTFPLAFVSELAIVFLSLAFVQHSVFEWVLQACFLLYVPVGYFTFKHLLKRKDVRYTQVLAKRALGRGAGGAAPSSVGSSVELNALDSSRTTDSSTTLT